MRCSGRAGPGMNCAAAEGRGEMLSRVFFPAGIPANEGLGSFTQNKGRLNVGGGISVRLKGDSTTSFYAESRYHYIYTTPSRTTVLPVTFGFRW